MKFLSRYNPFITNKASDFINSKYLFIIIIILFFILRLPLLESHFYHCDDNPKMPTYPLLSIFTGHAFWTLSEILHYKFFLSIPSFVFEIFFERSFSLVISFFSLWSTLLILKKLFRDNYLTFFIGIVYSCSQMLIIYSIHSSPYGYSMLPVNIMILYLIYLDKANVNTKEIMLLNVAIISCPFISISSIFLLPAFFMVLILKAKKELIKKEIIISLFALCSSVIVYLFQIVPLKKALSDRPLALNWNKGINNQFVYDKIEITNNPLETVWFFFKNTMLIIENNLTYFSYNVSFSENTTSIVTGIVFLPILLLSLNQLIKSNKSLVLFAFFSLLTFYTLVYLNLLTISPTRHLLWLNSFLLILIGACIKKYHFKIKNKLLLILSAVIILSVFSSYQSFYEERNNKVNYAYLSSLQNKFNIDYFFDANFSDNVNKLYIKEFKSFLKLTRVSLPENFTVCLVSHRPVNSENFNFKSYLNLLQNISERFNYENEKDFLKNLSTFNFKEKLIFSENIYSETEVGRTPFCKNGTNGRFLRIISITTI